MFFFVFFITRYYFSDDYKKRSHRSFNSIEERINIFSKNLIILENNTKDIVEYIEHEKDNNKRNYHFLKLLEND